MQGVSRVNTSMVGRQLKESGEFLGDQAGTMYCTDLSCAKAVCNHTDPAPDMFS